jgi:hypothetical protein
MRGLAPDSCRTPFFDDLGGLGANGLPGELVSGVGPEGCEALAVSRPLVQNAWSVGALRLGGAESGLVVVLCGGKTHALAGS